MAMDFSRTQSKAMVDNVMKKVDDTELDNKKRDIPVELIDLNIDNEDIFGYEEIEHLAERIAENGFYGAIEVYAKKDGRYEISSGHRRFLACKLNGMKKIPCIVSAYVDDVEKAKHLIEGNIHNRKMTPYRWAKAIAYYDEHVLAPFKKEKHGTNYNNRAELAKVFNMSESAIKRYKLILKLIPELQDLTNDDNFPYTNIIELSKFTEKEQRAIYNDLLNISGEDGIKSISKAVVDQVANKYVKDKTDARSDKPIGLKSPAVTTREIETLPEDDTVITFSYHTEDTETEDDIAPLTSVYNEDADVSYIPRAVEDNYPPNSADVANNNYEQIIYHLQCISNLRIDASSWNKEDKQIVLDELQQLMDAFRS